jgi:hypothetical protein
MQKIFEWMLDHRIVTGVIVGMVLMLLSFLFTKQGTALDAGSAAELGVSYAKAYSGVGKTIAAMVFGLAGFFFSVIALTITKSILDK